MDPAWLTGIGTLVLAGATLTLAGVTVWSVRSNNKANRLLREENKQLHELERNRIGKLQALEIISNWADEIARNVGGKMFSLQSEGPINDFLHKILDVTLDVDSVDRASKLFEDSFKDLVSKALSQFSTFRESIFKVRDWSTKTPKTDIKELIKQLVDRRIEALNTIFRLQKHVREHKVSLLI